MFETHLINKSNKFIWAFLSILLKYLLAVLTIITILAIFVPLSPDMPTSGLDSSWIFFMNEAMARHLNFGQDIIFTFGPYASIYTRTYHPATDHLMVFGSLFLGLCYAVALLYLAKDKPTTHVVLLVYIVMFLAPQTDALLFSYPLILVTGIAAFISKTEQKLNIWQLLIIAIIFAPLGLLPLIKGSLLPLCSTISIAIACYFFYHRYRTLGLLALISPIASMLIFWVLSRQSIFFLPSYLSTQVPIISGYTEAMALQGGNAAMVAYSLATIAIVWSLIAARNITLSTRLFLSICFLLFLFVAFKAGFTQYDGQTNGSAARSAVALVFATLIVRFIVTNTNTGKMVDSVSYQYFEKIVVNRWLRKNTMPPILASFWDFWISQRMMVFFIPIMLGVYIYASTPTKCIFYNPYAIYSDSWYGLYYLRLNKENDNNLRSRFEQSRDIIRQEYPIPTLQGTTDIYPWDQSYLLASNNKWNPRPIMQSYSAYAPLLAKINEQHLRGDNAPDNVLFKVQTIEGRFPSLDDGLSWPALLDNYIINKMDNDFKFIYLLKKPTLQKTSDFHVLHDEVHKTGENIVIPSTSAPIYAEIDLKPTLLGKLLGLLYKPPQLVMTLTLKNGATEQYRVIANMMASGFFMSPLIKNTKDFAIIAVDKLHYLNGNTVESFTLSPAYGGNLFWNASYQLKLKAYQMNATNNAFKIPFDRIIDFPEKHTEIKPTHCGANQAIELVSGIPTAQPKITITSLLTVNGWLTFSIKDGIAADETFITLTDSQGIISYSKTHRIARPDVKMYFKQPSLPDDVGFNINIDVTKLTGDYKLGLARAYAGKLEQCLESIIPITIKQTIYDES